MNKREVVEVEDDEQNLLDLNVEVGIVIDWHESVDWGEGAAAMLRRLFEVNSQKKNHHCLPEGSVWLVWKFYAISFNRKWEGGKNVIIIIIIVLCIVCVPINIELHV